MINWGIKTQLGVVKGQLGKCVDKMHNTISGNRLHHSDILTSKIADEFATKSSFSF